MRVALSSIVLSALIFATTALSASYRDISADKDSTLVYNAYICGDMPCFEIKHGKEPTLTVSFFSGSASRIILGFTLPSDIEPAQIKQCELQMQKPVQNADGAYGLSASEVEGQWDDDTVSGMTDLVPGRMVGNVIAEGGERPGPIDVTEACRDAKNGALSLLVDSDGVEVVFPSMETGAAAVLRVYTS
ncbi:hypothetical protein LPJ53_005112 [Coemansia erecta]|uniref:Uncharacterized protein n=1 Tax=Coemansia erecta TaxID=147472 RepID=A0A9W8CQ69_9FUNG|nr:hypothetical protein LPJ53_005112 [Coemansia erecta]